MFFLHIYYNFFPGGETCEKRRNLVGPDNVHASVANTDLKEIMQMKRERIKDTQCKAIFRVFNQDRAAENLRVTCTATVAIYAAL